MMECEIILILITHKSFFYAIIFDFRNFVISRKIFTIKFNNFTNQKEVLSMIYFCIRNVFLSIKL